MTEHKKVSQFYGATKTKKTTKMTQSKFFFFNSNSHVLNYDKT